jgi:two-component system LytT family response regulator
MNGFQVLRALPKENMPAVIFLTAYERTPYAHSKFTPWVICSSQWMTSGLPQPWTVRGSLLIQLRRLEWPNAFRRCSGRTLENMSRASRCARVHAFRLCLPTIPTGSVLAGDYAELHARGRAHLLRETMSLLERKLGPAKFLRIHRSRIVRKACIVELRSIENREYLVKLSDGSEHRSSRTYADRLESWVNSEKVD